MKAAVDQIAKESERERLAKTAHQDERKFSVKFIMYMDIKVKKMVIHCVCVDQHLLV